MEIAVVITQSKSDKNETNKDNTTSTTGVGAPAAQSNGNETQDNQVSRAAEAGNATEFTGEQFPKILEKTESLHSVHGNVTQFLDDKEFRAVAAARREHSIFVLQKEQRRVQPILNKFLESVARGEQDKAEKLLKISQKPGGNPPAVWLLGESTFTDYSGRTFNCTAYEYAYWAKDTHMCRMLERYMDDATKAQMLARVDAIESKGLPYRQNDKDYRSAHFDFDPLKNALKAYVDGFDAWYSAKNWNALNAAWLEVGKAQRDVPAHVAHEYCRLDRSFVPTPPFNEATLPRVLGFDNWAPSPVNSWFPLRASNSGLGFDFTLIRRGAWALWVHLGAGGVGAWCLPRSGGWPVEDLAAITRLDEVRTADLTQSRENLNPPAISQSPKA